MPIKRNGDIIIICYNYLILCLIMSQGGYFKKLSLIFYILYALYTHPIEKKPLVQLAYMVIKGPLRLISPLHGTLRALNMRFATSLI